jgi:hypothetical protein
MSEVSKGRFAKSVDTSIIEKRLRDAKEGDVVSYDDLSTLLGRDVREHCRGNMSSARNALIEESIFFDVIDGVGYKRLTNEESLSSPRSHLKRATNAARRAVKNLSNIKFDELSESGKKTHLVTSAAAGAVAMFGGAKGLKKIENKINSDPKQLPIGETLKLFGG